MSKETSNRVEIEEDYWGIPEDIDAKISPETRALLFADRQRFMTWFAVSSAQTDDTGLYEQVVDRDRRESEYSRLGWEIGSPAQETAWERSLSAEAATAVLHDFGATPAEACAMNGAEFAARFGQSWFDILPRVNG